MKIAVLLDTIYHLPVYERMLIVEHTIRSIRTGKNEYTVFAEPDVLQTHHASEQVKEFPIYRLLSAKAINSLSPRLSPYTKSIYVFLSGSFSRNRTTFSCP